MPLTNSQPAVSRSEWSIRLASDFFGVGDGLAFFYVDDDYLASLSPPYSQDSLIETVRRDLNTPWSREGIFRRLSAKSHVWRITPKGPPPSLPFLAVAVLAASHMVRDREYSGTNYYSRLAELLCSPGTEKDWRNGLSQQFEAVPPFWDDCSEWAGRRGRELPDVPPSHMRRIRQCLAHAVVKNSDRHVLTELWSALGQEHLQELSPEEILLSVKSWNRSYGRLSNSFVRHLEGSAEEQGLVGGIVSRLAQSWDGRLVSFEGNEYEQGILTAEQSVTSWELYWSLGDDGSRRKFAADDFNRKQDIKQDGRSFRLNLGRACFLAYDVFTSQWTPVSRLSTGSRYLLVYDPTMGEVAARFANIALGVNAARTCKPFSLSGAKAVVLPPLPLTRSKQISSALIELGEDGVSLDEVLVRHAPRARLTNGLRLDSPISKATYMVGGPPDVQPPSSVDDDARIEVLIDQQRQASASGPMSISLREEDLGVGHHQVEILDSTLEFTVIGPGDFHVPHISGPDLGWKSCERSCCDLEGGPGIRGSMPDLEHVNLKDWEYHFDHAHTFLAPREAASLVLIGTQGQIRDLPIPPISTLWERTAGKHGRAPHSFTARRTATEGWLGIEQPGRRRRTYIIRELFPVPSHVPPQYVGHQKGDMQRWLRFLTDHRGELSTKAWRALLNSGGVR